jgi:hypothetical protein
MPKVVVISKFEPIPLDVMMAVEVDVTSHGSFKDLSPFYLGPVELPNGERFANLENFWQYSKVFKEHVDIFGKPSAAYLAWRAAGAANTKANRYPMGKGAKPLYSVIPDFTSHGLPGYISLDLVNARKSLYIPYYAELAKRTKSYALLYKWMHNEGRDIVIRCFDGYDHRLMNRSFKDVVEDKTRPLGHGFVVMAMLTGELFNGMK